MSAMAISLSDFISIFARPGVGSGVGWKYQMRPFSVRNAALAGKRHLDEKCCDSCDVADW